MKKQIEITEKAKKNIEVEVPSFYYQFGIYTAITEHSIIRASNTYSSLILGADKDRYNDAINECLKYEPQPITKEEFETAFNNTIKCLTEQYQLSINMLDPNAQQATQEAAEQATDTAPAEQINEQTDDQVAAPATVDAGTPES